MLFTDPLFLFYFLPAALLLVRLLSLPRGLTLVVKLGIIGSTLVFYAYENWLWVPLFLAIVGGVYGFSALIWRFDGSPRARKLALAGAVVWGILALALFKYLNWLCGYASWLEPFRDGLATYFGKEGKIVLPPGISFYVFEALSFAIDVYRRKIQGKAHPVDYLTFIALFPRFIAGPIVRYDDISEQIRRWRGMSLAPGLTLFAIGFCIKVLFADQFAPLVGYAFKNPHPDLLQSWIGVLAYTFQLYLDFWGYSIMAQGLGLCLGFRFLDNFRGPYRSASITEFWRRWHISLSRWLRDYLYIPLGGNRAGRLRVLFNLIATMTLGGLWHGANLTFLVWGLYHGILLAIERKVGEVRLSRIPRPTRVAMTFLLVVIGWVLFRSSSFSQALDVLAGMVGAHGVAGSFNPLFLGNRTFSLFLVVPAILFVVFFEDRLFEGPPLAERDLSPRVQWRMVGCFGVAVVVALSSNAIPFLYYQF